jgi:small subunit ribosomal protein S7
MSKKYLLSNKKTLYSLLIGFLTKNGKKAVAEKILTSAFLQVSKKTNLSTCQIFLKLFLKLNSFVEIRKIKIRKKNFFVPFPTVLKRRLYLTMKWLMEATKQNNKKLSLSNKLAFEIEQTLTTNDSNSTKIFKNNLELALKNRSNLHYRW